MVKILVKKSAPKGVLIKKRVGQQLPNDQGLFQTPDRGKSFMDFARIAFGPRRKKASSEFDVDRPGIKPTARLAALAGIAGKGIAGLGAINETMNAMQGGNMTAPLGIGYSYERLDPTGRMISDYADPTLSNKPVKIDNTPPAKFDTGAALNDIANKPTGPTGPPLPADSPLARFGNPEAGLAPRIPGREQRQASTYPQHTMSRRTAFNQLGAGQPTGVPIQAKRPSPVQVPPAHVPGAVASNVTIEPVGGISQSQPPNYPGGVEQVPLPGQEKTLADHMNLLGQQPAAPIPPMSQPPPPAQPITQGHAPQPPAPQPSGQTPQGVAQIPGNFQQDMIKDPINPNNPQKSFVTALTEKLGADVVYKMSPHEIGTFAAYTLLKLR